MNWFKRRPPSADDLHMFEVTYELDKWLRDNAGQSRLVGASWPCPMGRGTHRLTWQPRLECVENEA